MLADTDAIATVAVEDLKAAVKFYAETLGLRRGPSEEGGAVSFVAGKSKLIVYESKFARTNRATAVTWAVEDVEAIVTTLARRGVAFEHYDDLPNVERRGDLHVAGQRKLAWFKDPDGNIHAITNR